MFRLHETTQRRVCRWAFVLLCAAPTLAVAAWILHKHRPWRVADEQQRLRAALDVNVRLADWREPRPGCVRTASLELGNPAEKLPFAKLSRLESRRSNGVAWLMAEAAVIDSRSLHTLATQLPLWLVDIEERELRFRCGRMTLQDSGSSVSITYHDVEAVVRRGDHSSYDVQLVARGESNSDNGRRLRATLAREPRGSSTDGALLSVTINSTDSPIPLWLLAAIVPVGTGWGHEAAFSGTLTIESRDAQPSGVAAGQFTQLDLSAISRSTGMHMAEGQAFVELDELKWRGDAVERVAGALRAENIRVSPSVIAAATDKLFCGHAEVGAKPTANQEALIPVDLVSCKFALDADGLYLIGTAPEAAGILSGCLAVAEGRALLMSPKYPRLHCSTWIQFLAGGVEGWVPASREAVDAAHRLPLPSSTERTADERSN